MLLVGEMLKNVTTGSAPCRADNSLSTAPAVELSVSDPLSPSLQTSLVVPGILLGILHDGDERAHGSVGSVWLPLANSF